jgi:hypothetical protein
VDLWLKTARTSHLEHKCRVFFISIFPTDWKGILIYCGHVPFPGTGAIAEALSKGTGLVIGVVRICLTLSFPSLVLSPKAKCCDNYTVLPSTNGVLLCNMLPEVKVVLMKESLGYQGLMLNWSMPNSHSHKTCTVSCVHPVSILQLSVIQAEIWTFTMEVQDYPWFQHSL